MTYGMSQTESAAGAEDQAVHDAQGEPDELLTQVLAQMQQADAILIGASNGLSISEGCHIFAHNQAFEQYFGALSRKYGFSNIVEGMYCRYASDADRRSFADALFAYMVTDYTGSQPMRDLLALVQGRPYFVITSNTDTHFQMNGFAPDAIFEIEGNVYGIAGKPGGIVEGNAAWISQQARCSQFINQWCDKRLLVLELGIGWRNQLIKAPLMQLVATHPTMRYVTFNKGEIYIPDSIQSQSIGVDGNLAEMLHELRCAKENTRNQNEGE